MEKEYWMVVSSGILSGLVIFGAGFFSDIGLSLYEIGILHGIFIIILLPFLIFSKKYRPNKSMIKFFAAYGFLAFLSNFTEFTPIVLGVPVAVVVLLLYSQPLWTAILSRYLLKENITKENVIATVLVILGVSIILNPFSNLSGMNPLGIILALAGGAVISLWIIFGRVAGKRDYNVVTTQFGYYAFMLFFFLLSYPLITFFTNDTKIVSFSINHSDDIWFYLFLYAVFAIIVSHLLYYQGAKKVPASTSGIIFLLEPISASILATIFLGQIITINIIIGGALILFSNYIVIKSRKNKMKNPEPL